MSARFIAGVLLVTTPLAFNVLFLVLQRSFDYPGVLRRPTSQILSRFALSAALILPGIILLSEVAGSSVLARIALPIGVFAGAVQLIGLMRWPFLVPYLARRYASPDASAAAREAIEITFESAHRFLGLAVGEHLGYLSTAVWTALIAFALVDAGIVLPLAAYVGMLTAVGIAAGLLEPTGGGRRRR